MIRFKLNDGGRKDAGFKGQAPDCVVRAIAIVMGAPYRQVRKDILELTKEMTGGMEDISRGVYPPVTHRYLTERGFELVICKNQYVDDLPTNTALIVCTARHDFAMVDGVVNDTWHGHKSRRTKNGFAKVRGYYIQG